MWSFIKIYKVLTETMGFKPKSNGFGENKFWLKHGDIVLSLVYDKMIPIKPEETQIFTSPLYALSPLHRKPDGRIDIYEKEEYCGSIILEMKYSRLQYVWDKERRTRCSEQLLHYGYQLNSIWKRNSYNLPLQVLDQINPIQGVLAILPSLKETKTVIRDRVTNIAVAELNPYSNTDSMLAYLEDIMKENTSYKGF